ncbi:hypothetical protein [Ramlibacter humi]|uniref:GAF domain-containing protein n=1 Tax=Ramlibacter humi TaxID=2530451 RepID=A0A4Z0C9Y8_9BURK|nr:hypothetical protein [Ramlibacter humi]TFZ07702.1 hypothetical protein EZ216_00620 [Ramlibacter humi]
MPSPRSRRAAPGRSRQGKLIGTLWVLLHRGGKTFSERDIRIVQDLTTFATAILDARSRAPAA